jgi:hypothetical protein
VKYYRHLLLWVCVLECTEAEIVTAPFSSLHPAVWVYDTCRTISQFSHIDRPRQYSAFIQIVSFTNQFRHTYVVICDDLTRFFSYSEFTFLKAIITEYMRIAIMEQRLVNLIIQWWSWNGHFTFWSDWKRPSRLQIFITYRNLVPYFIWCYIISAVTSGPWNNQIRKVVLGPLSEFQLDLEELCYQHKLLTVLLTPGNYVASSCKPEVSIVSLLTEKCVSLSMCQWLELDNFDKQMSTTCDVTVIVTLR